MKYNITAIILAAGSSTRFGDKNKLLKPFMDSSIFGHVVKTMTNLPIAEVILVTGYEHEKIAEAIKHSNVHIIHNSEFQTGIASSIKCGVSAASQKTEGYMICLGDMPYITMDYIKNLLDTFINSQIPSIIVPTFQYRKGNPVIFSKNFIDDLLKIEGDKGAREVIDKHPDSIIEVQIRKETYFFDVDTLAD
ncbi:nucleotidyltransferase family protein [candidate division KSB1 bacterium]|nr:nucleotidyltransferase family protein [candidate division KSB1 bacterium]